MLDLTSFCVLNAAYAQAIDNDDLERWPSFFTERCVYRITNVENERDGLAAGIVYADSRAMLEDRIAALRKANIYERQRYRHILGIPTLQIEQGGAGTASTPFLIARIMASGETTVFATGEYRDKVVEREGRVLLVERIAICDSTVTDTLLALPL
jgi:3-phenylpropionate/cinnamic acid dioxygenase small subunit